jgi:formamidopyrimidine-DNA glycosylase
MTGKFVNEQLHAQNDAHGRWYLELLDPMTRKKSKVHYHDTRSFGTLKFCLSKAALEAKLLSLGPDILQANTTTEEVFLGIVSHKNPSLNVCKFLMNQEVSVCEVVPSPSFCHLTQLKASVRAIPKHLTFTIRT